MTSLGGLIISSKAVTSTIQAYFQSLPFVISLAIADGHGDFEKNDNELVNPGSRYGNGERFTTLLKERSRQYNRQIQSPAIGASNMHIPFIFFPAFCHSKCAQFESSNLYHDCAKIVIPYSYPASS